MNQELPKKSVLPIISVFSWKPSNATDKSTLFAVSKDEWNTKENTGKFMKKHIVVCQKAPLGLKAVIELHLFEGISQSVSQSARNSYASFFLQLFKTSLGSESILRQLLLPHRYLGDVICGQLLCGP